MQHEQDQNDIAALRLQIANHQNTLNAATKSDQVHVTQLSELQRLHEEDQKALAESRARAVKDINDLNAQHQLEVAALQQQARLLEQDRSMAVNETTVALQEVSSLQRIIEEMGGQLKQAELTSINALRNNADNDQDNENLRQQIEALSSDRDNHQQQIQDLLRQINALQMSCDDDKDNYLRQVDTAAITHREEVAILQEEIGTLKSEIQAHHTQLATHLAAMEDMEQHIKQCELATIAALKQGV